MISVWLAWRLVKLFAVVLLAAGVAGALGAGSRRARMRAAHAVVTPALVLAWFAGYATMKLGGGTFTPWILAGMAASLAGFFGTVGAAYAPRPGAGHAALAVGGLLASVAVMVARPEGWAGVPLPLLVGAAAGAAASWALPRATEAGASDPAAERAAAWSWFAWVARVEGLTLVLLTLVSVPLKYGAGILLDGGTGLLGWTHGILVFVYLQALWSAGRELGWSWATLATAFASSMVPFGTVVFEWRMSRRVAEVIGRG